MELVVVSENIVYKEVFLDNRKLNVYDFGEISRTNRVAKDFNMSELKFIPRACTDEILFKYSISEERYKKICKYLVENISSILY